MDNNLRGLARTRNLAGCLEHPTAECGAATEGSRPTAANGKFPRRSEDTKLPPFMVAVVHIMNARRRELRRIRRQTEQDKFYATNKVQRSFKVETRRFPKFGGV